MAPSERKHKSEDLHMSMRTKRSNEAEIQTTESEVPLVKPREHEPLQYLETSLPITSLQSVAEASASAATALGDDNEGHSHANESESRSITIPAPISTSPLSIPGVSTIGISELYNPSSETTIVADVVFVHGIMGHPVDTWLYGKIPKTKAEKTGEWSLASVLRSLASALTPWRQRTEGWTSGAQEPKRSYCYWPFQLLPQDVKDMRILTYGYDSHPTHWYKGETNRMTITQHAESLLTELTLNRSECRGRPLIFVAHSLGGILVKSALNESLQMQLNQAQPAYADLQKSCHAVIFFGTPHLGASIAAFGEMVSNVVGALPGGFSTYGEVLRGLSPDSETLYNISRRFNDLLNAWIPASEKIQICSIQEGKGMTSVKGLDSKVVPDYSSKFNRTDIEQSFFIQDQNHMGMSKFSSASVTGYQNFVEVLKGYRMAILEGISALNAAEHAALLKQLNFTDRLEREQQLNRIFTKEQSFDWVWESAFVPWLRPRQDPLFWIVGHPASGKSTLINYIAKSPRFELILNRQFGSRVAVLHFFFDYRAVEGIRNNFQGFMRSLLYQILQKSPKISAAIEQKFALKQKESHEWLGDNSILKKILQEALQMLKMRNCLTLLFLDGLDEYKGEESELISLIDDISAVGVKICVSSRDVDPFRIRLRDVPSLRLDLLNRPGIEAYANALLMSSLRPQNDDGASSLQAFARHITEKSSGIFLWAHFAVLEIINSKGEDIMNAIKEGRSFDDAAIDEILGRVPHDLKKIYSRIFGAKENQNKFKCGVILRLITSARSTLHLSELYEASVLAEVHSAPDTGTVQQVDLVSFERDIKTLGGGIIELGPFATPHNDEELPHCRFVLVKIIHRTVQTYLEEQGWEELLGKPKAARPEHLTWLKVCSDFLQRKKLKWSNLENRSTWSRYSLLGICEEDLGKERNPDLNIAQLNLSEYVERFLPQHAYRFEKESETSSRAIIRAVLTPSFLRAHALLYRDMDRFPECFTGMWGPDVPFVLISGVHLAIAHQLRWYVEEEISEISQNPDVSLEAGTRNSTIEYPRDDYGYAVIPPVQKVGGPSLLETAVLCSSLDPSATRSALVVFLAGLSRPLNDEDMLFAIRRAPPSDLRALLSNFPTGKLQLTSKHLFHDRSWVHPLKDEDSQNFGPLWDIACRVNDEDNAAELLDLFVERGEDINARCGPYGTALHSAILCHIRHGRRRDDIRPMLNLLIDHGANPNEPGPDGNSLEFVWKLGNTSEHSIFRFARIYAPIIWFLIEKGALNQRRDPNGKIPTVERMLTFGTTWDNYKNGKRYYQGIVEL